MTSRFYKVSAGCLAILFIAAIVFRSYATARSIPVLGNDSCVFLPQTVPFYERGELINTAWNNERMTYHGFLYPMILGALMWRGDYPTLAAVLGILHGVATLLYGLLLWSFARRWSWRVTPERFLLGVFLAAACATHIQGVWGRPEALTALIMMGAVLIINCTPWSWHGRIAGAAIGLMTAVHPMVAVFAGLGFAAYAAWRFKAGRWWCEVVGAAGLSIIVFACTFLWYPYPFEDWLAGTMQMGRTAFAQSVNLRRWEEYLPDYLWSGGSWFLLGAICLTLWSSVRLIARRTRANAGPLSPIYFYAMLVIIGVAFYRFVLYAPWARCYLLPFVPLGFCTVFHELGRDRSSEHQRLSPYRLIAFGTLLILCLGLVGDLLQRAHAMRFDLQLTEARELFQSLRNKHPDKVIALDLNLFALTEDLSNIVLCQSGVPPADAAIFVDAQFNRQELKPIVRDGFQLLSHHFNSTRLTVFGVPVLKVNRGCGFAVYLRETPGNRVSAQD